MLLLLDHMWSKKKFTAILASKTINHFLITSGGTAINGLLGLFFYILVARGLGPSFYGTLAVAIAVIALISDVADLGVDTGIIRFVGKYKQSFSANKQSFSANRNFEDALKYLKLGLEIKLAVWLAILTLGWILAPLIAQSIFLKPEFINPFRLALIGVGGALLFSLTTHAIQAYQKFLVWSLVNVGMNGLRLLAVTILIFSASLNLQTTLLTYIAIPFLGFFITLFLLPNFLFVKGEKIVANKLFHYSKWVALVGIITAISSRLDTFISARLLTTAEVGIYSVAVQLTVIIPQLIFALATVVAPKLSSFDSHQKVIVYLKKLQLLVGGLFMGGIFLIPLIIYLIPLIYGQSYRESITPFIILFIAQLIFLLSLPSHQVIFYYFSKPGVFTFTALGQLFIAGSLGWVLISNFGVIGAALTVLVSNIFNFVIPGIWVIYRFQKSGEND